MPLRSSTPDSSPKQRVNLGWWTGNDVTTKDGITLRNIPDGTPDEAIKARIEQIRAGGGGNAAPPAVAPPQAAPEQPHSPMYRASKKIANGLQIMLNPGPGESMLDTMEQGANYAGGKVTDFATGLGASPEVAAGFGAGTNALLQAGPMVGGGEVAKLASPGMRETARRLMINALKPSKGALIAGTGERAAQTMLDEGVNVSRGGVDKLRGIGNDMNSQASDVIAGVPAKIPVNNATRYLPEVEGKFRSVDSQDNMAAIDRVRQNFLGNEAISGLGDEERRLVEALTGREAARNSALQDAGRFQTMAAQQESLAHGGGVNLAKAQPVNEPYMNVGALGGRSISPSAYPVITEPRIAGRYTENIQRVPEAQGAAADAIAIAKQRGLEQQAAERALADYQASGGSGMPLQLAQELKQGTYRQLKDEYGTAGGATTEARKALARALKEDIEGAAPAVVPLNKRASDAWNALNVMEGRALLEGNKDMAGITLLNPKVAAAMQLSRSALAKSMLARALNAGHEQVPANVARILIGAGTMGNSQGEQ